jgi:uncharacterized membrane protein YfcA
MTTIMMPATLAGTQLGAILLTTFPSLLIVCLLTALVFGLTIKSTIKAVKITKEENKQRAEAKLE